MIEAWSIVGCLASCPPPSRRTMCMSCGRGVSRKPVEWSYALPEGAVRRREKNEPDDHRRSSLEQTHLQSRLRSERAWAARSIIGPRCGEPAQDYELAVQHAVVLTPNSLTASLREAVRPDTPPAARIKPRSSCGRSAVSPAGCSQPPPSYTRL